MNGIICGRRNPYSDKYKGYDVYSYRISLSTGDVQVIADFGGKDASKYSIVFLPGEFVTLYIPEDSDPPVGPGTFAGYTKYGDDTSHIVWIVQNGVLTTEGENVTISNQRCGIIEGAYLAWGVPPDHSSQNNVFVFQYLFKKDDAQAGEEIPFHEEIKGWYIIVPTEKLNEVI